MMGNLKNKLARFLSGRYGLDQLYYALIAVCFVFIFANTMVRSSVITILTWAVLIWAFFRVLSRDIYKRRMENEKFLRIWNRVKAKLSLLIRRIKEIKTRRYRRCPHCRVILRLPRKKGKHTVTCPRCYNVFALRIIW